MRESGEVLAIENGFAKVRFKRTSACGHCTACGMLKSMNEVVVDVPNKLDAKVGETVIVGFSSRRLLGSSAIAYIIPLIFLITGVISGYNIPKSFLPEMPRDITAALLGIILTALAFLGIGLLEPVFKRRFKNSYEMLEII